MKTRGGGGGGGRGGERGEERKREAEEGTRLLGVKEIGGDGKGVAIWGGGKITKRIRGRGGGKGRGKERKRGEKEKGWRGIKEKNGK